MMDRSLSFPVSLAHYLFIMQSSLGVA